MAWIGDAIAFGQDFVPQIHKGAHFAHFGYETDACIHKE